MALFGGKKSPIDRALGNLWSSPDELAQLRKELLRATISPRQAQQLLFHDEPTLRDVGARAFLKNIDRARVALLFKEMSRRPPAQRRHLANVLPRLSPELVVPALRDALADKHPEVREAAWEASVMLAPEVRQPFLIRAVSEAPRSIRPQALRQLADDHPPGEIADILIIAVRDDDQRMVDAALDALSSVKDPRVLDVMVELATSEAASVRERARSYLVDYAAEQPEVVRPTMLSLLSYGSDWIRQMGVEILLTTGREDEVLGDILRYSRRVLGWLRTRIMDTLKSFGPRIVQANLALLRSPDPALRAGAVTLTEFLPDPRAVEPLCAMLLEDPDWWIRVLACDVLGKLKDDRALPALIEALNEDVTRWGAIEALTTIGDPAAIKPLVAMLNDDRREVRLEVIKAIDAFGDRRAVPVLDQVIRDDPSAEVRTRAAEVARRLESRDGLPARTEDMMVAESPFIRTPLDRLLAATRHNGASDLHLTAGEPPFTRQDGHLLRVREGRVLTSKEIRAAILAILDERQRKQMWAKGQVDFCYEIPEVGRYRANLFSQRKGWSAVFRVISNMPPTLEELGIPKAMEAVLELKQGLVIVTGPVGAGKSSTMAALVNLVNENKNAHIVTLEDPIEFVHPSKACLVDQREVPAHSLTFARGLRSALRQDPDVIMVGEMREPDTIRMALMAAETGHLVLATLHTPSAIGSIGRIIDTFPTEEQPRIRGMLADTTKIILSQFLLPRDDRRGRTAIFESLEVDPAVATLIRDNKLHQIANRMTISNSPLNRPRDAALMEAVEQSVIKPETAWRRANDSSQFEAMCSPEFLQEVRALRQVAVDRTEDSHTRSTRISTKDWNR